MNQEEIAVVLNLRATLSEYEHFMCELESLLSSDAPEFRAEPSGGAKFPMKDKLWGKVRAMMMELKGLRIDRDRALGEAALGTKAKDDDGK